MEEASDAGGARRRSRGWLLIAGLVLAAVLIGMLPWILLAVGVARGLGFLWEGGGVTISEETTRISEPIGDDGYIDYLAALDQASREGVTPENNAAVLLWQAFGPTEFVSTCGEARCDWYFRELGIPCPAAEGDYFVTLDDHAEEKQAAGPPPDPQGADGQQPGEDEWGEPSWHSILHDQSDEARQRPWSKEEFPELAAWLERNEKPLRLVVAASERERFYAPRVPPTQPPPLINALIPGCHLWRSACRALAMRAMLRLEEGNTEEAWQDLLACHRLARLVGQAPTLVEGLVAVAMDGMACSGDAAVAQHGNLTAERARQFRADLRQLAPLPNMVDKIDCAERFTFLDMVTSMFRDGPAAFADMEGSDEEDSLEHQLLQQTARVALDWDGLLGRANAFYDRVVETARAAERSDRVEAVEKLNEEIVDQFEGSRDLGSLAKSFLSEGPGKVVSEKLGQVMLAMMTQTLPMALEAEDRALMTFQMTELALALAGHRADHGSYPERLEQLVPEYIEEVPPDLFAGDALRYQSGGQDYLCYSVGVNREDEEGRTYDSEPPGDDLVIRTTPAEAPDD